MQTGSKASRYRERSGAIITSGRVSRTSRFEHVNRLSQTVNSKISKPYERENGKHQSCGNSINKRFPVKTRGAIFGGLEAINTDPTRDPPPRACYNCWQRGHAQRDCPRPTVARYCKNCGRRGEDLKSCPRCKLAHEKNLLQIEARDRGEELDPDEVERLMPESEVEEQELDNEENACDAVLREIMLRDERAKIVCNEQMNNYQERYFNLVEFGKRKGTSIYKERDRDAMETHYTDRGKSNRRNGYRSRDGRYKDKVDLQHNIDIRERKEKEEWNEKEREGLLLRVQDSTADLKLNDNNLTTSSGIQITSDPVQDFLLLAKTIAHLSPETQDLIMRQVISERKEHQARLKVLQNDMWA